MKRDKKKIYFQIKKMNILGETWTSQVRRKEHPIPNAYVGVSGAIQTRVFIMKHI